MESKGSCEQVYLKITFITLDKIKHGLELGLGFLFMSGCTTSDYVLGIHIGLVCYSTYTCITYYTIYNGGEENTFIVERGLQNMPELFLLFQSLFPHFHFIV